MHNHAIVLVISSGVFRFELDFFVKRVARSQKKGLKISKSAASCCDGKVPPMPLLTTQPEPTFTRKLTPFASVDHVVAQPPPSTTPHNYYKPDEHRRRRPGGSPPGLHLPPRRGHRGPRGVPGRARAHEPRPAAERLRGTSTRQTPYPIDSLFDASDPPSLARPDRSRAPVRASSRCPFRGMD